MGAWKFASATTHTNFAVARSSRMATILSGMAHLQCGRTGLRNSNAGQLLKRIHHMTQQHHQGPMKESKEQTRCLVYRRMQQMMQKISAM